MRECTTNGSKTGISLGCTHERACTRPPVCEQDRDVPYLHKQRRRRPHKPKAQVHSQLHAHEVSPQATNRSVNAQPYGSSYFLPAKLAGKAVTFLLDTGCTTNLLSRRLFDILSARDRSSLEPYDGEHGTLADGSGIPFYGVVESVIKRSARPSSSANSRRMPSWAYHFYSDTGATLTLASLRW